MATANRISVSLSESDLRGKTQLSSNVRALCSRVQRMLRQRRRKQNTMQISAPYNLQREPVILPGISEDEIAMLREKAAASRIGIADETTPLRSPTGSVSSSRRIIPSPSRTHGPLPTRYLGASTLSLQSCSNAMTEASS